MPDQPTNETPEARPLPRWIGQRRGRLVAGGVIGLAGIGGAFAAMTPATTAGGGDDAVTRAARDVVAEKAGTKAGAPIEWDLPNLDHDRVDFWVERFSFDPDMREKMEGFLQRSGIYVPMLLEKLEERDMPRDLIYLAMIESGFQPTAYSHAAASGLWQFIAETGQRYGLEIDRAVDERNDPVKATDAALDYLQELHERFGSWYLAAASYNTGENRVGRIMRQTYGTEKASSEEDYYKIWSKLPRETRDYVPLMIAAGRIAKDPAKYGFDHVVPDRALAYDEVMVPPATQLPDIADAAGVSLADLKALNPHFKLNRTPNNRDYAVRLPAGSLARFASSWGLELGPEGRAGA
ncbi:MAG TPA: lytic transglycosylase domain-containing protein, partial [Longimicrobiales bacterium]|nr:lytic transglycosylase domain-containing protein [Longimicrobiales bacterium]